MLGKGEAIGKDKNVSNLISIKLKRKSSNSKLIANHPQTVYSRFPKDLLKNFRNI